MTEDDAPDPHSIAARLANFSGEWAGGWIAVYLSNLIVPLMLGWGVTENGGRVGMCVQVVVIGVVGLFACGMRYGAAKCVAVGGVVTALMQLFPIVHLFAGLFALSVSGGSGSGTMGGGGWLAEASGALATLLTAAQMILLALFGGVILRAMFRGPTDEPETGAENEPGTREGCVEEASDSDDPHSDPLAA